MSCSWKTRYGWTNKWAQGVECDQSSSRNLTSSDLLWSFLKYIFHCFCCFCSLFLIRTRIVTSDAFLILCSRDFISPCLYWSVTKYHTFLVHTLWKRNFAMSQLFWGKLLQDDHSISNYITIRLVFNRLNDAAFNRI